MNPRAEFISDDSSFVATSSRMDHLRGSSVLICRPVVEGLPGRSSFSSTLSLRIYNRGSSWIILVRLYPEGSSHDTVTSLGSVESGVLGFLDSAPEIAPRLTS